MKHLSLRKYETIELNFDDEELLKYMKCAHEQNITLMNSGELAFKAIIKEK